MLWRRGRAYAQDLRERVFADSYAVVGGVAAVIPVDLVIRGCPPTPTQLLRGLLTLMEGSANPP